MRQGCCKVTALHSHMVVFKPGLLATRAPKGVHYAHFILIPWRCFWGIREQIKSTHPCRVLPITTRSHNFAFMGKEQVCSKIHRLQKNLPGTFCSPAVCLHYEDCIGQGCHCFWNDVWAKLGVQKWSCCLSSQLMRSQHIGWLVIVK